MTPTGASAASSLRWDSNPVIAGRIILNLHPYDVVCLTSTCRSLRAAPGRAGALIQTQKIGLRRDQIRTAMEVGLPHRVAQIYAGMKALGPVPVISTHPSYGEWLYPIIDEMRSSCAIVESAKGKRGIVVLVRSTLAGSIELPAYRLMGYPTMRIPCQSIFSRVVLREEKKDAGDRGWQLQNKDWGMMFHLEKRFFCEDNLFDHPDIAGAFLSIFSGTHPSLALTSPAMYNQRHEWVKITTECKIPKDYSLVIRGNGAGMDNWRKDFPMVDFGYTWWCRIRACVGTEYKIFLKTPAGDFIPENDPNRRILFLRDESEKVLYDDDEQRVTSPAFISL